jgi:hypothetical protein
MCVKQTSNGASQALKRSSHAGALRGSRDSTARQRTEVSGQVQALSRDVTRTMQKLAEINLRI